MTDHHLSEMTRCMAAVTILNADQVEGGLLCLLPTFDIDHTIIVNCFYFDLL